MEAPELERRLAAIVAADVEGYSRLMHRDEEGTMAALSARRAVLDELIVGNRGRIANTAGDSVLAEFASVLDAVSCAIEIQRALARLNDENTTPMLFRIGINVGDVMVKDGDLFGDGVNVAARLEGLAEGGGICVSRGVRDHLRYRTNLLFEDLGEQLVKNIAHPVRAFRLRLADDADGFTLEPPDAAPDVVLTDAGPLSMDRQTTLELAFWESVKDGGPAELAAYLDKFPDGTFAALARTRRSGLGDPAVAERPAPDAAGAPDAVELAFWDSIKDSQDQGELQAYLDSYPAGHFAELAQVRLARADAAEERGEAAAAPVDAVELAFWESIRDGDDAALFQAYLDKFPDGEFAVIARARLASPDTR